MKKFALRVMRKTWAGVIVEAETPEQAEEMYLENPYAYEDSFEAVGEEEFDISDDTEEFVE